MPTKTKQHYEYATSRYPVGWFCECGLYNDILNSICWACGNKLNLPEAQDIAIRVFWNRQGKRWIEYSEPDYERRIINLPIDDKDIEKHSKFFNHELGVVNEMSLETLQTHIEELEEICFEAKVRIQASKQNQKERVAKLSKEERDKLISKGEFNITESDSLIRKRVEKVSKADKTIESLKALGISDEDIKKMMANVVVKESKTSAVKELKNAAKENVAEPFKVIEAAPKNLNTQKSLRDDAVANGLQALKDGNIDIAASSFSTAAHIAKKVDDEIGKELVEWKKESSNNTKLVEEAKSVIEEKKDDKPFWDVF